MTNKQFDRYKHFSQQAAIAERKEAWQEACNLWTKAQQVAAGKNEEWCRNRADFCDRMAERQK
ncbi:hypothetical protein A4G20_05540 [Pasteurellaceae bacterium RH1A]|nr:hypothetical protein A4G20_05540 [Pasteurellaceae bacterium RH1A]